MHLIHFSMAPYVCVCSTVTGTGVVVVVVGWGGKEKEAKTCCKSEHGPEEDRRFCVLARLNGKTDLRCSVGRFLLHHIPPVYVALRRCVFTRSERKGERECMALSAV